MASTGTQSAPNVVELHDVSKRFVVRKDKSLRERLVTLGRLGRKHREEFWALREIDLDIPAGITIGLIGHNGSGKSTLLKIIGGILEPSDGTVRNRGRIAALLELGAGFHPDLTGRENVFLNASILGLSRKETEAQMTEILDFASIGEFIDTPVKFYSSGMYVRLAFAVAVHTDPDILLVDEVLAVGDEAFQRKCLDKIRSFQQEGRTIILVSHSLNQVQELCSRVILLDRGQVVHDGDPSTAVAKFRNVLEARRKLEETAADVAAPTKILHVSVTAEPAREDATVLPGDDLAIDVVVDSSESMVGRQIAVQIDSTMGQVVWGTTTKRLGIKLKRMIGTSTVRFNLPAVPFGSGKYFVSAYLIEDNGVHIFDYAQAAWFDVPDAKTTYGPVRVQPTVEFD